MNAQAQAVLDVLDREYCHLTVEEILSRIPGASTATVYRVLDQLTASGEVRKLALGGRRAVYERARTPHAHFICRKCGAIRDIPLDLTGLVRPAAAMQGCTVLFSDTIAGGYCGECAGAVQSSPE